MGDLLRFPTADTGLQIRPRYERAFCADCDTNTLHEFVYERTSYRTTCEECGWNTGYLTEPREERHCPRCDRTTWHRWHNHTPKHTWTCEACDRRITVRTHAPRVRTETTGHSLDPNIGG